MKLNLINGNGNEYQTKTDLLLCFYKPNEHVIKRLKNDLELEKVKEIAGGLTYFKPKNAMQIVKLLTWASTYSYQISYSDNASQRSTLYFKYRERPDYFFFN